MLTVSLYACLVRFVPSCGAVLLLGMVSTVDSYRKGVLAIDISNLCILCREEEFNKPPISSMQCRCVRESFFEQTWCGLVHSESLQDLAEAWMQAPIHDCSVSLWRIILFAIHWPNF